MSPPRRPGTVAAPAGRRPAAEPRAAARLTSRLPLVAWLTAVWTGLWGDVSAANVLGGLAVGAVVVTLLPLPAAPRHGRLRPLAALRLLGVFAVDLVRANVVVAAQVLRASTGVGPPLRQAIVACPLRGRSDRLTTLVANMVSLTPGTLTVEIDRLEALIYVHVLDLVSPDELRQDVRDLEARVIRTFGSDQAVAELHAEGPRGGVRREPRQPRASREPGS